MMRDCRYGESSLANRMVSFLAILDSPPTLVSPPCNTKVSLFLHTNTHPHYVTI